MAEHAYYAARPNETGWKNSIRHNLTMGKGFTKVARAEGEAGKGGYWMINEGQISDEIRLEPRDRGDICKGSNLGRLGWRTSTNNSRTNQKKGPEEPEKRKCSPLARGTQIYKPSVCEEIEIHARSRSLPPSYNSSMIDMSQPLDTLQCDSDQDVSMSGPMLARRIADSTDMMEALLDPFELCQQPSSTHTVDNSDLCAAPSDHHLATVFIADGGAEMAADCSSDEGLEPSLNRSFSEMMFT